MVNPIMMAVMATIMKTTIAVVTDRVAIDIMAKDIINPIL
jgi:hypothetical protein